MKTSGGTRKYGRNLRQPTHKRYATEKRWIKNKAKKIFMYMKKHSKWIPYKINDDVKSALSKLQN